MKTLILFLIAATCYAQLASFELSSDTLLMQNNGVRHAVGILIQNRNGRDVIVEPRLSDTTDFAWQGIGLDAIPLGEFRRVDIYARRTIEHDTVCIVTLKTNSLFEHNGEKIYTIYGIAGTLDVKELQTMKSTEEKWYDLRGESADTSHSGMYLSNRGRKRINVR